MRNKKTVLMFIFMMVLTVTTYAQQYESESDFTVSRLRNSKREEEIVITAYLGDKTDISIPPRIQNLPVTRIEQNYLGENVFPSDITSVIMPNSLTSIGRGAFANCSSLTSITIPNIRETARFT